MSKKPTVLMILDGFGLNDNHKANAVYEASTPNIDSLMKEYPFAAVGLRRYTIQSAHCLRQSQRGDCWHRLHCLVRL